MIEVYVGGLPAVIREDIDFTYIAENSFFSSSDGYSLAIEFPLEGCPENVRIFGRINRDDVVKPTDLLPCSIRSGDVFLQGALSVVDVDSRIVKAQFLEGINPESEDDPIDALYIDELYLGEFPTTDPREILPMDARRGTGLEVCYPWYNTSYDVVNNRTTPFFRKGDEPLVWHEDTRYLSWQPYLIAIARRIAEACRYQCSFGQWEDSVWKDVIICNSVPGVWDKVNYADVMPHWSPRKFFEALAPVMKGSFVIDSSARTVSFQFWSSGSERVTVIGDVADEYSASVTNDEDDADFLPIMRFRYPEQEPVVWKYLDCPWILNTSWTKGEYQSLEEYDAVPDRLKPVMFFIRDLGCWFISRGFRMYSQENFTGNSLFVKTFPYAFFYGLQPVNVFGPPDYDKDLEYTALECAPVVVDVALEGKMMWLKGPESRDVGADDSAYQGSEGDFGGISIKADGVTFTKSLPVSQSRQEHTVENHSDESDSAVYSTLFLGLANPDPLRHPYPLTDVDVLKDSVFASTDIFRLSKGGAGGLDVDPHVKYTFRFLLDHIPDVSSIFLIHGQRYVCRSIEASFSRAGMSPLLKGIFFRCKD